MSYYTHHVFFCCNQRDGGRVCCNDKGASVLRDYAKRRVKELGRAGKGKARINAYDALLQQERVKFLREPCDGLGDDR
jgi:hypothetical protein